MIDFLDRIYTSNYINRVAIIGSLIRLITRIIAKLILPIYFDISNLLYSPSLELESSKCDGKIIVSLTSFPERIGAIWMVIESILRQKVKPDAIYLWLSKDQFPDLDSLPLKLRKLQPRGLEIRLVEGDLKSHKKYFYALKEFPNDFIITIDDDVFYNSKVLESLLNLNKRHPRAICANEVQLIKIRNGVVEDYSNWPLLLGFREPNILHVAIGVGGILYPPKVFNSEVFNQDVFMDYCEYADDIWLYFNARLNKSLVAKSDFNSKYLPIFFKTTSLHSINLGKSYNDIQFKALFKYYSAQGTFDIFNSSI